MRAQLTLHQSQHIRQMPRLRRQRLNRVSVYAGPPKQQMLVYVPPHPLVNHWVAVLRNKDTPSPIFRSAMAELGRILIYEASREWLPTMEGQIETPCGVADVSFIDPTRPISIVPILRSGLVLLEQSATLLPATVTYHVGCHRDEKTFATTTYLNKLPPTFSPDDLILVSDPMMATGGTMVTVLSDIVARGATVSNIRVISAVCAPPALTKLNEKFPGLKVYTGIIDAELNDKGYVVPGIGDAGDRSFGTL